MFASAEQQVSGTQRIVVGLISIAAAVLTSLQTFLRFGERADRHRAVGAGYGALRRSLEYLKTFAPTDEEELKRAVGEIRAQMDTLAREAPEVPSRMKKYLDAELKGREHRRIFHLPGRSSSVSDSAAT